MVVEFVNEVLRNRSMVEEGATSGRCICICMSSGGSSVVSVRWLGGSSVDEDSMPKNGLPDAVNPSSVPWFHSEYWGCCAGNVGCGCGCCVGGCDGRCCCCCC